MNTLFERIKPEFAGKIVDDNYPTIASALIKELNSTYYFTDLKLNDVTQLYKYVYGIWDSFNLTKYYNIFNEQPDE